MEDLEKKPILEGEEEKTDEEVVSKSPEMTETSDPAATSAEENEAEAGAVYTEEDAANGVSQPAETELVEENGAIDTSIKTFTQDDVDKLVGDTRVKTREKTFNYIYGRYGVKNEEELDALVANAQRYDTQKEMYDADKASWEQEKSDTDKKLTDMSETIALMQSGVDADRYEDVKLILKGKGLEVTLDNINSELETHPEWKGEANAEKEAEAASPAPAPAPVTRIKALGNEQKPAPQMSEEEEAEKLFKLKFH